MITRSDIGKYNALRSIDVRDKLCHAPTVNLNFEQNGNVTACCFNRSDVLGRWPEQSISEIWNGKPVRRLRKLILDQRLDGGCKLCGILLESGNYQGTKAIHYDEYAIPPGKWDRLRNLVGLMERPTMPRVFEFEISNTCNLECEMCNGYFSSTIRKNRERLPPIESPYNGTFVDQVAEFMPHLTDLKFLGGEPFLVDIYYRIWERVAVVNPNIKIHVTTNGTVFNSKVRDLLTKLKVGLVVSIDSVDPQQFEAVRGGAKFSRVMENFNHFLELTKQQNTYLSIAACAMSSNWKGIPDLVRFANEKNVPLHFNVVWNPGHLSMRYMRPEELEAVSKYLSEQQFPTATPIERMNRKAFDELRMTVDHWKQERATATLTDLDSYMDVKLGDPSFLKSITWKDAAAKQLAERLLMHFAQAKPTVLEELSALGMAGSNDPQSVKSYLFELWKTHGDTWFFTQYFGVLPYLAGAFYGEDASVSVGRKCERILAHVTDMRRQQAIISDLIDDIDRKSIVNHLQLIKGNDADALIAHVDGNY